ncbi:MAG: hypothetical protein K2Q01_04725, partial [Rickettsiales bacterium]|nr:hypothetical protein [Rickettsiales bacterium]
MAKSKPMFGREREVLDARLNDFRQVMMNGRGNQQEMSWVLFDKDDPAHAHIPGNIRSMEDLPRGAVVLTVDLSPLSREEEAAMREHEGQMRQRLDIPKQSHAIYLTAH